MLPQQRRDSNWSKKKLPDEVIRPSVPRTQVVVPLLLTKSSRLAAPSRREEIMTTAGRSRIECSLPPNRAKRDQTGGRKGKTERGSLALGLHSPIAALLKHTELEGMAIEQEAKERKGLRVNRKIVPDFEDHRNSNFLAFFTRREELTI